MKGASNAVQSLRYNSSTRNNAMLSQKKESYISYFKINAKQSNLGVYRPQIGSQNFTVSN